MTEAITNPTAEQYRDALVDLLDAIIYQGDVWACVDKALTLVGKQVPD